MTKWQKKITKSEREHLKDNCIHTLRDLQTARECQRKMLPDDGCFECRHIAIKLGIENKKED